MDSRLDRYISNEYLVSPCPQAGRGCQDSSSAVAVRSALDRARKALQQLRNGDVLQEPARELLVAVEDELMRVSALLDDAVPGSWVT